MWVFGNTVDTVKYASDSVPSTVYLKSYYTLAGTVTLKEPIENDMNFWITAKTANYYYDSTSLSVEAGKTYAEFCLKFATSDTEKINIGDYVCITLNELSYNDRYVHMDSLIIDNVIKINDFVTEYNFEPIEVKKAAEIFKGIITIPSEYQSSTVKFNAKCKDECYSASGKSDENGKFNFVIYGKTEDISDYNGEYEVNVSLDDNIDIPLNYCNGELSIDNKSVININGETSNINLQFPKFNSVISGNIILPTACENDIDIEIVLYDKTTYVQIASRTVVIPRGTTSHSFNEKVLTFNDSRPYCFSYAVYGDNALPYYTGLNLYIADDGYSESIENAKEFLLNSNISKIDNIELSPFKCSSFISGKVTIPDGFAPANNTYFNVSIEATNGERTEEKSIRFNAGETSKPYSISIPDLYNDGDWKVSYTTGSASAVPTAPVIKREKFYQCDSPFSMYKGATASSGGGWGGDHGGYYGPINVIPNGIIAGTKVYYVQNGITFEKSQAGKLLLENNMYSNIDFELITTNINYPRKIGGYFCSSVSDAEYVIYLINSNNGEVVKQIAGVSSNESNFYEFTVLDNNSYVLKVEYEEKTYYFQSGNNLSESIDDAYVILPSGDPNTYGLNMYYENIKSIIININCSGNEHRVMPIKEIISNPNYQIRPCIFNLKGELIARGNDFLSCTEDKVLLGFECGGKEYYFCAADYKNARLCNPVSDYKYAKYFILPHDIDNVYFTLDLEDFMCGSTEGLEEGYSIHEAYLNYEEGNDSLNIESIYIDLGETKFNENDKLYIAIYDNSGRLIGMKISDKANDTIPLNWIMKNQYRIKVFGLKDNLQPLYQQLEFMYQTKL